MPILLKAFIAPLFVFILSLSIYTACTSYGNPGDSGVDAEENANGDPGDYSDLKGDPGDYPNGIPELPEYCPANMRNTHPPVVVEYYGVSGILPKDAYEPTRDTFVTATWEGVRRLAEPYQQDCIETFITNPPGLPCSADTVLDLRLQDDSLLSFLLGVEVDDLMTVPVGTPVEYSTPFGFWDVDSWGQGINLIVRDAIEGRLLLAAMGWDNLEYNLPHRFGSIEVDPRDDYVCYYMEYMDCKHYGVAPISVISGDEEHRVEPGESIVVPTSDGDYRVTLRRGKVRTCFEGNDCCADYEANRFSYSIVVVD